ncbi:MAG: cytochrome c oxidase subunit 3 [Planctomycetota bacterium]
MTSIPANHPADDAHDHHDHDLNPDGTHGPEHLAHHFDTPTQQYASGKLGMWVFLGTEILMFGGLFVAYFVYRANHPDVFQYAAQSLNTTLGFINTLVLITSSLTMALAVRAIQLGNTKQCLALLLVTLLGGFGFMGIKSVEYYEKISKGIFLGSNNIYSEIYVGEEESPAPEAAVIEAQDEAGTGTDAGAAPAIEVEPDATADGHSADEHAADDHGDAHAEKPLDMAAWGIEYTDPNAGTGDAMVIKPTFHVEGTDARIRDGDARVFGNHNGLDPKFVDEDVNEVVVAHDGHAHGDSHDDAHGDSHGGGHGGHGIDYADLSKDDQANVDTFYGIYYAMTGLHGVHVLIGMGLIGWVALKTAAGTFSPKYFTPVDIVGLYWHLVDLIWIFLFPLLYLIH